MKPHLISFYYSNHIILSDGISRLLVPGQKDGCADRITETLQRFGYN